MRRTRVLGEHNEAYEGLPGSWRAAIRWCPYCDPVGSGRREGAPCAHCDGTGDLLGVMLLDAYRRGREHVLVRLKEVDEARQVAVRRVREEAPDADELKRAMGL